MRRVLSFEQSPPLSAPLRFFLTAPAFAAAAALMLLWYGPDALQSRWSSVALAITHLLSLGFMAMTMIGALLQILPVVGGVDVPRTPLTATVVHALLTVGAAILAATFLFAWPWLFALAATLLAVGFLWFLAACAWRLWNATELDVTMTIIRYALAALFATVLLGITLAVGFAGSLAPPFMTLTHLHVAWGLPGWIGLLAAGVAFQVVPMFLSTPLYPAFLTLWLPRLWLAALLLRALIEVPMFECFSWVAPVAEAIVAFSWTAFPAVTLSLLWRRKRPGVDVTVWFWRLGAASLLACVAAWALAQIAPGLAVQRWWPLLLGALFLVGFGYSIVNGMLYKIVPFLAWYHLQSRAKRREQVPNVKQIVTDANAFRQFIVHAAGLILLLGACLHPAWLARPAALAFGASSVLLGWNLLKATAIYLAVRRAMEREEEGISSTCKIPTE
jgi:hypothetical protein